MIYKLFTIDNTEYLFIADNLEIIKIQKDENLKSILQKHKTNIQANKLKAKPIDVDFFKDINIDTIGIDLTNGCNLDCKYCFISASKKKKRLLSVKKFLDILEFFKKSKEHPITFYFAGAGEPTFNFKLIKQLPILCMDKGFKNCFFDLTTNGTILTKEMISFFKANLTSPHH